jgi:hypothetical protein
MAHARIPMRRRCDHLLGNLARPYPLKAPKEIVTKVVEPATMTEFKRYCAMPWSLIAEPKNSNENPGHHWGGIAVTWVWVLNADETNHKKGTREKVTAKRTPRINMALFINLFLTS